MALYKFKVYLDDNDEVYRIIEIKPGTKFINFHDIILQSFGFDNKHNGSFYMSDDTWKKGEQIVKEKKDEKPLMKDAKMNAFINDPHQKIIFIYDDEAQWMFYCELNGIEMNENAATDYPNIAKTVGKSPKQYTLGKKIGEGLEEDEFEYLTRNLLAGDVSEEEMKEHSGFSSDGEDEEEDEDDDMVDDSGDDYDDED